MDLFVYGTLLFPEVLQALLGRVPPRTPAAAAGWRAAALPGRVYPGLVPHPGRVARGIVIGGLDDAERRVLDAYEDTDYLLISIALTGGRRCQAYVWQHGVLDHDWDPGHFAANHLHDYVRRCLRWRARQASQPAP